MKATTKKTTLPPRGLTPKENKFEERFETETRYYIRFYVRPRFVVYAEYSWANDLMGFRVFYGEEKLKFSNYYSLIKWCDQHD